MPGKLPLIVNRFNNVVVCLYIQKWCWLRTYSLHISYKQYCFCFGAFLSCTWRGPCFCCTSWLEVITHALTIGHDAACLFILFRSLTREALQHFDEKWLLNMYSSLKIPGNNNQNKGNCCKFLVMPSTIHGNTQTLDFIRLEITFSEIDKLLV